MAEKVIGTETGVGQPVFREHTFSGQTGLHEEETASPSPHGEPRPPAVGGTSLEKAVHLVKMSRLSTQCDEAQGGSAPKRGT